MSKSGGEKNRLRWFNNVLTIVVVGLGLYILIAPYAPEFTLWWRKSQGQDGIPYSGQLVSQKENVSKPQPPKDNRLVIPAINLNEPILENKSISVINNGGTWHRPKTPSPLENGNSVIVGHRFFYSAPATMYHLDKVNAGDKLAVYWQGQELVYEVAEKKIVDPTDTEVEASTKDRRLTIYTCTPLWTTKNRLVIIAKPLENAQ